MGKVMRTLLMAGLAMGLALSTLSKAQDADTHSAGAVFVMTNNVDRNEVITYRRASDGTLQEDARFATGGRGSGGITLNTETLPLPAFTANRSE